MEKQQILQDESAFKWRKNSLAERRRMRNERKKRKRHQTKKENELKADATQSLADRLRNEANRKERLLYLARKYYLKWLQNKEDLRTLQEKAAKEQSSSRFGSRAKMFNLLDTNCVDATCNNVSEINWNHLMSPKNKDGNEETIHLGHGVFGKCQKRYYKGIPVAVKVFNNLSSSQDVSHEATIMAKCAHPSIPHLFGVNVTKKPYFTVSYFYGIGGSTCTLYRALHSQSISLSKCSVGKIMFQLCKALEYLHSKHLLHRDIKGDNILLTTMANNEYHPMLIDFGKAILLSEAPLKQKSLTALEQADYRKKHRHIAPEIVLGQPPSFASDIFSFGVVMSDVSGKIESDSCFLEGQRKSLERDPNLRCSVTYLLLQLERNASLTQQ